MKKKNKIDKNVTQQSIRLEEEVFLLRETNEEYYYDQQKRKYDLIKQISGLDRCERYERQSPVDVIEYIERKLGRNK